jgi:hypothetical protein
MGRPCHKAAFRSAASAVVVAVAVVIPVASGIAAETKPSVVPAKLAAKWNRNVTTPVKVSGFAKRGVWSIVIGKVVERGRDLIEIYAPGDTLPTSVGRISVTGNRVSFTANSGYEYPICPTKGIYQWKVVGQLLTMSKVSDNCRERIAVFTGAWTRK